MRRAAVLIGVDNANGLAPLQDAVGAARRMLDWVRDQGFLNKYVRLITDEKSPVTLHRVRNAISLVHDAEPPVEQLLIYFSGHGINNGGDEVWLLSTGFTHAAEAVNVAQSATLARYGRIHHVIFISDACRTAPAGIRQQQVTGAAIFPTTNGRVEKGVDLFFASSLGEAALEVQVPDPGGTLAFSALYTTVLLEVLKGGVPAIVEDAFLANKPRRLIRPWPLKRVLGDKVAEYLIVHKLHTQVSQTPGARISSDPSEAWIAQLPASTRETGVSPAESLHQLQGEADPVLHNQWRVKFRAHKAERARSLPDWVDATLDHLLGLGGEPLAPADNASAALITAQAQRRSKPFSVEGDLGLSALRVEGVRVAEVLGADVKPTEGQDGLQVYGAEISAPARALVIFKDGSGVLVPLLPNLIAVITFDQGRWSGLAYERSGPEPSPQARYLREFISATAERGVFQPDQETLAALVEGLLVAPFPDPVLMLHLAYALDDAGMGASLRKLAEIRSDGVPPLFDVALLASGHDKRQEGDQAALSSYPPGMPLFARGWPALVIRWKDRPSLLNTVSSMRLRGLWSHFTEEGVRILRGEL